MRLRDFDKDCGQSLVRRLDRGIDSFAGVIGRQLCVLVALTLLLGVPASGIVGVLSAAALLGQIAGNTFAGMMLFSLPIGFFVGVYVYPRHVMPAVLQACRVLVEPPPRA